MRASLWSLLFANLLGSLFPLFADPVQVMDSFTDLALKEWKIPGAAVIITKDDKVIFIKGYGVLKDGAPERVNGDTIFQLASITKAFTAAGLGIQVDQGKLKWDEEVINYLSPFALMDSYPSRYTTARDLLAHRTGLPAFTGDLLSKLGYDNAEILRRIRFIEPASSFRESPHYSNVGYFIAGELLAAVAKNNWQDTIQKTILDPLGMKRTGFASIYLDSPNVARGHARIDDKLVVLNPDLIGGFPAAGGICSTASDMGKWMIMLLNGGKGILKSETIQEMFASSMCAKPEFSEAAPISAESGFNFGMGWDNYHYHGKMIVEKGGGLDGVRTVTTLIPQLKIGITVLCNLNLTSFPEAIRAKFLEEYLGKSDEDLQAEILRMQTSLNDLLKPEKPLSNPLPHRSLKTYAGDFSNDLYGTFKIIVENDELVLQAGPAQYPGKLKYWSNDTFQLSWPILNMGTQEVTFTFGPDGKATQLQTETFGNFKTLKP